MNSTNKKFNELYDLTIKHLEDKKYLYRPQIYDVYKNDYTISVGGKVINKYGKPFRDEKYSEYIIFTGKNELGRYVERKPNEKGEIILKKGEAVVDKDGNVVFKKNTAVPNKNVLLSIAFSMALENYNSLLPIGVPKKRNSDNHYKIDLASMSDMLLRYFSNKYYKTLDDLKPKEGNEPQKNELITIEQDFEYENIEKFREVEYKLHTVVSTLRNYHSHFVHEGNMLNFEDYFNTETKLNKTELQEAKNWFKQRFEDAKTHLSNSLKNRLKLLESDVSTNLIRTDKKKEELKEVINTFEYLYFLNKDGQLTLDGQLFIACMFLYRRQAKIVLERWRNVRKPQGYQNTLHTFFTYFSLSERYSLYNFSDPLLKFRDITSKLSSIPGSTNPQLQFIYQKIKLLNTKTFLEMDMEKELLVLMDKKKEEEQKGKNFSWIDEKIREIKNKGFSISINVNEVKKAKEELIECENQLKIYNENIEKYKNRTTDLDKGDKLILKRSSNEIISISTKITELKDRIKYLELFSINDNVIPVRKRHILTPILLQYLLDNDLFSDNMKIAIKKTPSDRFSYFEKGEYIDNKASLEKKLMNFDKDSEEYKKITTKLKNEDYLDTLIKIKDRLKELKKANNFNEEYLTLKDDFKYLKRNFTYKSAKELQDLQKPTQIQLGADEDGNYITKTEVKGFRFSVKENNAQIQFTLNDTIIPITLSPDLLLKWVFIHLTNEKNDGKDLIVNYIENHINRLIKHENNAELVIKDFIFKRYKYLENEDLSIINLAKKYTEIDQKNYPNSMNLTDVFPKAIMDSLNLRINRIKKKDKVEKKIKLIINKLTNFKERNANYDKPYTKESKEKIDTILEYIHFRLLLDVYQNKIHKTTDYNEETFLRKYYFNIITYNVAREYFRFYGRYENNTSYDANNNIDFVNPVRVTELKKNYKECFKYVENEINTCNSLEELFNSVISEYILQLKELQNKINTITNINKILKIDEEKEISEINKNLKPIFLDHLALGHNVISIKDALPNEWQKFENARPEKLKKNNNFSDFSFIRKTLEATDGGKLKTNIDYLFKVILPQTDEVKNNNGKIKPTVFNKLLKLKTEELILWNVAKSYRGKKNIAEMHIEDTKETETSFQQYTTFNKAYKMDLEYPIIIDKEFWDIEYPDYNKKRFKKVLDKNKELLTKTIKVVIKVPAKRYDNKFLKVETKLIKEYLLWNHCKDNEIVIPEVYKYTMLNKQIREYKLHEYDDLMKVIYRDLKMSLSYIGEILRAEKKLLQINDNSLDIKQQLYNKYKTKPAIRHFYLDFNDNKNSIFDKFIDAADNNTMNIDDIKEYLKFFRNFALHYQLQDPERKKEVIKLLDKINKGYVSEQEFTREEK